MRCDLNDDGQGCVIDQSEYDHIKSQYFELCGRYTSLPWVDVEIHLLLFIK